MVINLFKAIATIQEIIQIKRFMKFRDMTGFAYISCLIIPIYQILPNAILKGFNDVIINYVFNNKTKAVRTFFVWNFLFYIFFSTIASIFCCKICFGFTSGNFDSFPAYFVIAIGLQPVSSSMY